MLPFEKKTIRIYKFYFKEYDNPIIIEADDLKTAQQYLIEETNKFFPFIENLELEDLRIITPVYGITEKEEKGIVFFWAGFDHCNTGWLTKEEFNKLEIP